MPEIWASAAAAAIGLALAGNLATSAVHVTGWWRPVIWIVVVILAVLTVAIAVRDARARPLPGTPAQIGDIDEAALLKKFVRGELARSDDRLRQVSTGKPLQVHWTITPVAESAVSSGQLGPIEQHEGDFKDICQMFHEPPSLKRIVFLGDAGTGKTILVTQLAKYLLEHARKLLERSEMAQLDTLIPFYTSAADWDPSKDIITWVADQLLQASPQLRAKVAEGSGGRLADDWVKHRVLPIIDGLDELPPPLRVKAIADVNDRAELPVVITSRRQEYMDAFEAAGRLVSDSTVVSLSPLKVAEVRKYLLHATSIIPDKRWEDVFGRLNNKGEDPLKEALTNPLMLWLASRIYETKESFPKELADDIRFGDREAIESHLLRSFVPAVYSARAGAPILRWTPEQAQRYLGFLASHAEKTRSPDIAWWRLSRAVRRWRLAGIGARAALLSAVAWLLGAWLMRLRPEWRDSFRPEMLFADGPLGRHVIPLVRWLRDLLIAEGSWPIDGRWAQRILPWHSLISLAAWAALLAFGTVIWWLFWFQVVRVSPRIVRIRSLKSLGWAGQSLALPAVLAGGLLVAIAAVGNPPFRYKGRIVMTAPFPAPAARAMLLFVILLMLQYIPSYFVHRMDPAELASPSGVLRSDRRATIFVALAGRLLQTLAVWLFFGPLLVAVYGLYCAASFACRLALGSVRTASDRFSDARVWLACSRRMPWKVLAFLEDASERGVLRRSGAAYQFRHLRLRQELTVARPRRSRGLALAGARVICNWRLARRLASEWSLPSAAPWSEPFWVLRFADRAADELPEGLAAGAIRNEGPGFAQTYTGNRDGQSWMICALPGCEPVIAAAPVWQALRNAASQAMRNAGYPAPAGPLTAVGFPAADVIRSEGTEIPLEGGSWGNGVLSRQGKCSDWRWEPTWSVKPLAASRDSSERGAQLRVSARAVFWWDLPHLRIKPETYEIPPDQLASLPQAVTDLWTRRGGAMPEAKWKWSFSGKRRACLLWEITSGKKPVMTGTLDLSLTPYLLSIPRDILVTSEAELRIEDTAAWADCLQATSGRRPDDGELRLSLTELTAYLSAAWHTAAETLPLLAVEYPFVISPEIPPSMELQLSAAARRDEELNCRDLRIRADFSPHARKDDSLAHLHVGTHNRPIAAKSARTNTAS